MSLRIGPGFTLPDEAVTQTFGILAKRGVGKTYTANVMAEEMYKAGLPFVVVDPIGVWWGLRSSADGKKPGLAVTILGGEAGDVPLEPTGGKVVADLLVDSPTPIVIDLSEFRKGAQRTFMTDFLEQLYHRNREPLHVFLDEADAWAPQRPAKGAERLLGACEDLVRRGRARGLGVTMITQRPASIHKDVLTQIEVLVALRVVSPQDRNAIDEWIKVHGTPEQRTELLASLAKLPIGTSWWWSPGWLDVFQQVKVRTRQTFDSSATPTYTGRGIAKPTGYADVDLTALRDRMAETIERAKAVDPKALQRRILELEKELREARAMPPKIIEVETPADDEFYNGLAIVASAMVSAQELLAQAVRDHHERTSIRRHPAATPAPSSGLVEKRVAPVQKPVVTRPLRSVPTGDGAGLPGPQRKLLTVLATYGPRTKKQLAFQAGYSMRGGGFNNPLSALRSGGLVERGEPIAITDTGLEALGSYEPLPTGGALLDHWLGQLPGPAAKILEVVASVDDGWSKEDLAERCGYSPVGGGFNNPLSRLRSLELVTRGPVIALTDEFAEAIR
jgi:hypothetical protein